MPNRFSFNVSFDFMRRKALHAFERAAAFAAAVWNFKREAAWYWRAARGGIWLAASALAPVATSFVVFPPRFDVRYAQVVTARDGAVVSAFLSADDAWRMKTELDEISPALRRAFLSKEDRRFYWHAGVDPVAIARAALGNLARGRVTSGASTITMQTARLLENYRRRRAGLPPAPRTFWRKALETLRALQLEIALGKSKIFELYLTLAPYGGNIEGVKAASLLYFGQPPDRLSLAQAATLAIIPNRPTLLALKNAAQANEAPPGSQARSQANSQADSHAESQTAVAAQPSLRLERDRRLRRFGRDGVFGAQEVADALSEPLGIARRDPPALAPHLALRLKALYPDAPVVRSALDLAKQSAVQTLAANKIRRLKMRGINNAAAMVVNNRTREVEAYIGSPDFSDKINFGEVDGARAPRSPGSALKPLIYGLAMDKGLITPKTTLTDAPVNLGGYAPENFDRRYNGVVTAEKALINSLNVPAVKLLERLGAANVVEALKQARFEQIRKDEKKLGLSLALGGCGARLDEMAGLYAAFANEGRYEPLRYSVAPAPALAQGARILSPAAAFMLAETLAQLSRPDVPNKYLIGSKLPKISWKTGTSYGRRDAWSVGYNKRYTVAVWVGNFSGVGVPELVGAEIATPLLFEIFNAIDYDAPPEPFAPPAEGLDFRLVCAESGLLPAEFCSNQISDYYVPSVSSNRRCEHLKPAFVAPDESVSYCRDCLPASGYREKLYPNLPPELAALYASEHYDYARIPPHNPACKRLQTDEQGGAPVITSLVDGKQYLVERDARSKIASQLALACHIANDARAAYWFVDDRFVKAAAAGERVFFTPTRGEHKISCSDDKGRNVNIWISVECQ